MEGYRIKTNPLWNFNFSKTEGIYMNHTSGDSQLAKEIPVVNFSQIRWPSSLHKVSFYISIVILCPLSTSKTSLSMI
jgi:hypothetical protein